MAEIPKLDLSSSCFEALASEKKSFGGQKMMVSDHINAFEYTAEKGDSFVIDMDAFSSSNNNKDDTNANSRITLQRSLSRKGSLRLGDRKVNSNATIHDKDAIPTICSPKGSLIGVFALEKPVGMAVGSMDHSMNPLLHHQNSMTANISCNPTESKCSITRRNSLRRPSSWAIDPKRVLLFFATLSSMGTMLLIYFTLAISKQSANEYGGD